MIILRFYLVNVLIFLVNFWFLVLSIAPGDEDAIRCKVVALIKNDKIEDALSAIEVFSKKFAIDLAFYKVR